MGACQSAGKDDSSSQPTSIQPKSTTTTASPTTQPTSNELQQQQELTSDQHAYVLDYVSKVLVSGLLAVDPTPIMKPSPTTTEETEEKLVVIAEDVDAVEEPQESPSPTEETAQETITPEPAPQPKLQPKSPLSPIIISDSPQQATTQLPFSPSVSSFNVAFPKSHLRDESDLFSDIAEDGEQQLPITFHILKSPISSVISTNKTAHGFISKFSPQYASKHVVFVAKLTMSLETLLRFQQFNQKLFASEISFSNDLCIVDIDLFPAQQLASPLTPDEQAQQDTQIRTNLEVLRSTLEQVFRFVILSVHKSPDDGDLAQFGSQFVTNLSFFAPVTTSTGQKTVQNNTVPHHPTPRTFNDLISIYQSTFYFTVHQQTPQSNPLRFLDDLVKYSSFLKPFTDSP